MRTLTLFAALFLLPLFMSAQVQYTSNDFANPGSTSLYSSAGAMQIAGENFSDTGEDYVWDFTGLEAESQQHNSFIDPEFNGFRESFIALCVAGGGGLMECLGLWNELAYMSQTSADTLDLGGVSIASLTSIYDKTDEAFLQSMVAGMIGTESGFIPVVLELEDHDTILQFPMEYQEDFISHGRYVIDLTPTGEEFKYTWDRVTETTVEGYGSLHLPWNSYDEVLKVIKEIEISDTLVVSGTTIENPFNNQVVYQWYDVNEEMVVFEVTGYRVFGGFEIYTNAEYMDTVRCLQPSALFYTSPLFPALDPETGTCEVTFNNLSSNADSWEWDFGDPESGASNYSSEMNPVHVFSEEATYNVTLTAINNTCEPAEAGQIVIPVTITDTVSTGLQALLKEEITLAPNPFSKQFTVSNTTGEKLKYIITDIHGRKVIQGEVAAGVEEIITLEQSKPGLYCITYFFDNKPAGTEKIIKTTQKQ